METDSRTQQGTNASRGYKPSQYSESTWETVSPVSTETGQAKAASGFQVTHFELLEARTGDTDPMFSEFDAGASARQTMSGEGGVSSAFDEAEPLDGGSNSIELEPSEDPAAPLSATAQHEEMIAAAREEGHAQGKADAEAELAGIKAQLAEQFTILMEDVQSQSKEIIQSYEQKTIELAFQIARRMVGEVVEQQREYVIATINEGIRATSGATIEAVRVSPQDYEFLMKEHVAERIKSQGGPHVVFESDETIKAGCVITTSAGQVDFDLDKAWARLRDKVIQGPQS